MATIVTNVGKLHVTPTILRLLQLPPSEQSLDMSPDTPFHHLPRHRQRDEVPWPRIGNTQSEERSFLYESVLAENEAAFRLLRMSFVAFIGLVTTALLIISYVSFTDAGPLVKGAAMLALWGGQASVAWASHSIGQRTGFYVFTKTWSPLVLLFTVGMMVVAVIAAVESWMQQ